MRIKTVNSLVGGEILAEPIVTEKNEILIPNGTTLKNEYVPLIEALGIDSVMIEDPYENYESPNSIIDIAIFNKYVEKVRRLMESHIYHGGKSLKEFEIIANDIVRDISNMPSDVIVDIVESGATLRENDMEVVAEIAPSSARLIANKSSYQFKRDIIDEIKNKLEAAK